jgi:hypothetical protein
MSKTTIERQFIREVVKLNPLLTAEPVAELNHVKWGNRVKFNDKTGIRSLNDLKEVLIPLGITKFKPIKNSGKITYENRGYEVEWNNSSIRILLNSSNQEEGLYPRKTFGPEKLGLSGFVTSSDKKFIDTIKLTIKEIDSIADEHKIVIVDLIESVLEDRQFNNHSWLQNSSELSILESDLGEVLAIAYSLKCGKTISVPDTSNNKLTDFNEDNVPVSVKSTKGGSVTLTEIPISADNTPVEQVIKACGITFNEAKQTLGHKNKKETAQYRKERIYECAAKMPGIIKDLSILTKGTTFNNVKEFIKTTTYFNFIQWVKSHPENTNGLGIPDMEVESNKMWNEGSTEPFYFTLCTLIFNGPWVKKNQQEVSSVLKSILTGPKFYDVKIDLNNKRVIIKEQKFDNVENWTTHYWSRCYAAFHNLPGARRMKETK